MIVRIPNQSDLPAIARILDETELFPREMLDELISPFLEGANQDERWYVCENDNREVAGFGYCRREPLTEGTWNLLAIGVRSAQQGLGIGATLMKHVEESLADERLLIVETSGLDSFSKTRSFYTRCGYELVATIPEYWSEGDDKVIFSKKLS